MSVGWLSPSSLSTARQCLRRFHAENVLRRREPPGPEAVLGTFVHRVLEMLVCERRDDRTIETARRLANSEWPEFKTSPDFLRLELNRRDTLEFAGQAIAAVHRALELIPLDRLTVLGIEQRFDVTLDGVPMHGIVDLVVRDEDGLLAPNPDGRRVDLIDYKTGAVPVTVGRASRFDDEKEAEKLVQAHIYNAAAAQLYNVPVADVVGQLVYIGEDVGILFADPADTPTVIAAVAETWETVKAADVGPGPWPATPGPLCGWCPHIAWVNEDGGHDFCPEGLAYAFNKIGSRWGWTARKTGLPTPAAATIAALDPEVLAAARRVAAVAAAAG